jgi:hypothetical protein
LNGICTQGQQAMLSAVVWNHGYTVHIQCIQKGWCPGSSWIWTAMIYLFSIDSQRCITVGLASLACVRSLARVSSLACRGRVSLHALPLGCCYYFYSHCMYGIHSSSARVGVPLRLSLHSRSLEASGDAHKKLGPTKPVELRSPVTL